MLIGWAERADFPDWGAARVPVKIDTGARTAAADALEYRTDGDEVVARLRLNKRGQVARWAEVRLPLVGVVRVRNTGGVCEERPVAETTMVLGPAARPVRLTLARRPGLIYPVILGRTALAGDFLVDAGRKNLLRRTR